MDNLLDLISSYDDIVIVGHVKPDGDAVGSCLALSMILKQIGKNPKVILEEYTTRYDIIPGAENIYSGDGSIKADLFISLDCASKDRFPETAAELFEKAKLRINIDHHISNELFADYNYVEAEISSTSELVYKLFANSINFNKDIAAAIYAGIIFDTGGLRFNNTSHETMRIAAKLMELGIDHYLIYTTILNTYTFQEIVSVGRGIQNIIIDKDYNTAYSFFTLDEMRELNVNRSDLEFIISFIMKIENIHTGVFIYETEKNKFKVSLRSSIIDVSELAKNYGGGGHTRASGCSIDGNKDEVYNIIKTKIRDEIKNVERCN